MAELTEEQTKQIKETHDTVTKFVPFIEEHHKTLYGNGQPGLVKDHLKFKTQVITAIAVLTALFTFVSTALRLFT